MPERFSVATKASPPPDVVRGVVKPAIPPAIAALYRVLLGKPNRIGCPRHSDLAPIHGQTAGASVRYIVWLANRVVSGAQVGAVNHTTPGSKLGDEGILVAHVRVVALKGAIRRWQACGRRAGYVGITARVDRQSRSRRHACIAVGSAILRLEVEAKFGHEGEAVVRTVGGAGPEGEVACRCRPSQVNARAVDRYGVESIVS